MANENYDQVPTMYAQGRLSWERDRILAMLLINGEFDAADKTMNDLTGDRRAVVEIPGRFMGPQGAAMGLPAVFPKVAAGPEYQIVLVQDVGNGDPNLLSYIDTNEAGNRITVQRTGTLIARPIQAPEIPDDRPPTIGVWMTLTT